MVPTKGFSVLSSFLAAFDPSAFFPASRDDFSVSMVIITTPLTSLFKTRVGHGFGQPCDLRPNIIQASTNGDLALVSRRGVPMGGQPYFFHTASDWFLASPYQRTLASILKVALFTMSAKVAPPVFQTLKDCTLDACQQHTLFHYLVQWWGTLVQQLYWPKLLERLSLHEMEQLSQSIPWDHPAARAMHLHIHKQRMKGGSMAFLV